MRLLRTVPGAGGSGLVVHPDGDRYAITAGEGVQVWSRQSGERVQEMTVTQNASPDYLMIHPDNRRLFVGCKPYDEDDDRDGSVMAFDLETGDQVATYSTKRYAEKACFDLSADGQWIASAGNYPLHVWHIDASEPVWSRPRKGNHYALAAIHDDWVAAWNIGTIEIRQLANGSLLRSFEVDADEFGFIRPVILADGKRSVWNFDGDDFVVIDLEAETAVFQDAHKGGINSIAVSPDEKWLLTGGQDRAIRLWDLATLECVAENVGGDMPWAVAFVDNQHALVSRKEIELWDIAQPPR